VLCVDSFEQVLLLANSNVTLIEYRDSANDVIFCVVAVLVHDNVRYLVKYGAVDLCKVASVRANQTLYFSGSEVTCNVELEDSKIDLFGLHFFY